jgi:hypothetical protein
MDQKDAIASETHDSEHAPDNDNGELQLKVKVLRSRIRTGLRAGPDEGGCCCSTDIAPTRCMQ